MALDKTYLEYLNDVERTLKAISELQEDILDEKNTSRDVYADSAYRSAEHEADLKQRKFRPHLQRKGCKGHQLTSREKRGNLTRARIRSRIEHVFGAIHQVARRRLRSVMQDLELIPK